MKNVRVLAVWCNPKRPRDRTINGSVPTFHSCPACLDDGLRQPFVYSLKSWSVIGSPHLEETLLTQPAPPLDGIGRKALMKGIEQRPRLYDAGMTLLDAFGLNRWRKSLFEHSPEQPLPNVCLEVGCGTGRTLVLHPPGGTVVGSDPELALLLAARRRAPQAFLVQARAEALPFPDGSVDEVISSLVFCSVADPRAGLREVHRILKPRGRLRMLEHVRPEGAFGRWLSNVIQPAWTAVTGGCHPNRDTEALVVASGFQILPETQRAGRTLRRFDAIPSDPFAVKG